MKKRIRIIFIILICVILLIPIRIGYKDGGTVKYAAIAYSITKQHSLSSKGEGFYVGTRVRILLWKVYDDVKYDPDAR